MQFSLRQLRYFVAAAEAGSVTGAARALAVSQPSVSTAIAQIEDRFGVQLFLRHHARGISPTPAGRRLLDEARQLLGHAQAFASGAEALSGALSGPVDLGCFLTFAPFFVPALLVAFKDRYPQIEVRLREGDHASLQRDLATGLLDLALLYDLGLDADLIAAPVAALPPYVLLPAGHRLAGRDRVPLAALNGEPFILLDLPASRDYFLALLADNGVDCTVRHRTASFEMVRGLVANGHGFSLLNLRPRGETGYDGRRAVARPVADAVPALRLVVARSGKLRPTAAAAALTTFCQDHLGASECSARG